MKTRTKSTSMKNIDLIVAELSENEIMGINEMLCIRGGDGDNLPPTPPGVFPTK